MELIQIAAFLCGLIDAPEANVSWDGETVTGEGKVYECVAERMAEPDLRGLEKQAQEILDTYNRERKEAQAKALRELLEG